jgi:hypothetical protein
MDSDEMQGRQKRHDPFDSLILSQIPEEAFHLVVGNDDNRIND